MRGETQIFVAMCNRVGREDGMDFAGESLIVHPSGDVICKADDRERLIVQELDLAEARLWREHKRRTSGSGGRSAICKQSEPRTGSPVRGSFFAAFIYTPGTDSAACPDSCVRTRWR